jgi:hypothetical protein
MRVSFPPVGAATTTHPPIKIPLSQLSGTGHKIPHGLRRLLPTLHHPTCFHSPLSASTTERMAKEAVVNALLSCFMHVGLTLVLLVYLPLAFVCRLVARVLVRPFATGEDLGGKVVLVTGASSGIGEVSLPCSQCSTVHCSDCLLVACRTTTCTVHYSMPTRFTVSSSCVHNTLFSPSIYTVYPFGKEKKNTRTTCSCFVFPHLQTQPSNLISTLHVRIRVIGVRSLLGWLCAGPDWR